LNLKIVDDANTKMLCELNYEMRSGNFMEYLHCYH